MKSSFESRGAAAAMKSLSEGGLQVQHVATMNARPAVAELYMADYDGSGNLIYEGWADPGTATSAALWVIKRYVFTGSNLTSYSFADGNASADNIWDNRASLTYL